MPIGIGLREGPRRCVRRERQEIESSRRRQSSNLRWKWSSRVCRYLARRPLIRWCPCRCLTSRTNPTRCTKTIRTANSAMAASTTEWTTAEWVVVVDLVAWWRLTTTIIWWWACRTIEAAWAVATWGTIAWMAVGMQWWEMAAWWWTTAPTTNSVVAAGDASDRLAGWMRKRERDLITQVVLIFDSHAADTTQIDAHSQSRFWYWFIYG